MNFDFLQIKKEFRSFAPQCIEAEKALSVSPANCIIMCRRALELVVRWMYAHDGELSMPFRDNLTSLVDNYSFREIISDELYKQIKFIIQLGNQTVHTNAKTSREEAVLALNNLYCFISTVDYFYSYEYSELPKFDENALPDAGYVFMTKEELSNLQAKLAEKDQRLEEIIAQNEELRIQGTAKRNEEKPVEYVDVNNIPEWKTRIIYIDVMLKDAGWDFDNNVVKELEVHHMSDTNPNQKGFVDYALYGKNGKVIAVVEAKKTSVDPHVGQQQAYKYANSLEIEQNLRPIIFYTNGFETYLWDDHFYPERRVSSIFSQDEIQRLIDRRHTRLDIDRPFIDDNITNRYYQKNAITRVCEDFMQGNRKALLVMATGSGKTRVAISIVDVLTKNNWVKNILFLADRTALVKQAKANFVNLLPSLSTCNLLDNKDNPEISRMIFSTYPTMMNAIDEVKSKNGKKLFTPGFFDLIILDESHRSIYKKYKAIFEYFDSLLIGLTATPKDDIDINTYSIFDLETGVPTYAYDYSRAVEDHYLVSYHSLEYRTKFMEEGIHYDDLTEEEKEQFEEEFSDEPYILENGVDSNAMNEWLFNNDTVDTVILNLMEQGIKVEGGDKIGKTIIFAANQKHADFIAERFNILYPEYHGLLARVITYNVKYAQDLIDNFSKEKSNPQIAISVDMLDTGIDVPEVVNLVFFKKVRSKAKFWQMMGRGTRLRPDLFGPGEDKKEFLVFDYCNNMEFFRAGNRKEKGDLMASISERIFNLRTDIVYELEQVSRTDEIVDFVNKQINELSGLVSQLNEDSFNVRLHIESVHKYKNLENWLNLTSVERTNIKKNIAPLITINDPDASAKNFDALMYYIELAYVARGNANKHIKRVISMADYLYNKQSIPEVKNKVEYLSLARDDEYWGNINLLQIEKLREEIRNLVKYITSEAKPIHMTDFDDKIISQEEGKPFYDSVVTESYKEKLEFYLKNHQDDVAIQKIKTNVKLEAEDIDHLEKIFWNDLGSKEDYYRYYGEMPLTKLIRSLTGLDREAANEAFSEFLNDKNLSAKQIQFIQMIVDYIVMNGYIQDKRILQEDPFRTIGSIAELFKGNMNVARGVIQVVDSIYANC